MLQDSTTRKRRTGIGIPSAVYWKAKKRDEGDSYDEEFAGQLDRGIIIYSEVYPDANLSKQRYRVKGRGEYLEPK